MKPTLGKGLDGPRWTRTTYLRLDRLERRAKAGFRSRSAERDAPSYVVRSPLQPRISGNARGLYFALSAVRKRVGKRPA